MADEKEKEEWVLTNGIYTLSEPRPMTPEDIERSKDLIPFKVEGGGEPSAKVWTVELTSPKMYSWAKVEYVNYEEVVSTSDPLKTIDLKHGQEVFVESLFGLAKMTVQFSTDEFGRKNIYVENEGNIAHVVTDEEGYAGCPMMVNRKALRVFQKDKEENNAEPK